MSKVYIQWMDTEEPRIIPNVKDIIHDQSDKTLVLVIEDEKRTEMIIPLSNIRFIAAEDKI